MHATPALFRPLSNVWARTFIFLILFGTLAIVFPSGAKAASGLYNEGAEADPIYSKVGPLNAIVIKNIPGAPYIVYLHGYGGTGADAFTDLQPEIDKNKLLKQFNWIFPDSPRGGWFDVAAVLDSAGTPNTTRWQCTLTPTRHLLSKMIESAKIDPRDVIWGGFSEGAITATDFVIHSRTPPRGLIVNSGIYFNSTDWQRTNKNLAGVPFFMSHDKNDQMLPFQEAKKLEELLLRNGMVGKMQTHSKDHSVPHNFFPQVLRQVLENPHSFAAKTYKSMF